MSTCPACGGTRARAFFEMPPVPVLCNVFHDDADTARAVPRGTIRLALCPDCAFVHNEAFEPGLLRYDAGYETSLHHSPFFCGFAEDLAHGLTARHLVRGDAQVVEVGCGRGDFLRLFAAAGRRCVGFDRSYDGSQDPVEGLTIHAEDYRPTRHGALEADLVICRHVLEHVPQPGPFVARLAAAIRPGGALYLEVPDVVFTLRDGGIWDLIYEHCGHFTAPALERLCRSCGLPPVAVESVFGGQFLAVEARRESGSAKPPPPPQTVETIETIAALADGFAAEFDAKVHRLGDAVAERLDRGGRVAVWGAGSKGVTFLNVVPRGAEIQAVVDVHPGKRGRHVAGTGQRITAPDDLTREGCDLVVVMNPNYRAEIEAEVERLELRCDVLCAS